MNLLEACDDPHLFRPWFRDRDTWTAWRSFVAAVFGLPMDDDMAKVYRQHTGRQTAPGAAAEEAWLIIGRRGGKSFVMALIAVYLAAFRDYQQYLQPGERATVMVIAADRRQARVIIRYIGALLTRIPMLQEMITRETAEAFDLGNAVTIEVGTASFRTTRGYTYAAVLADEIAFWRTDDAAEPDYAILDALRPGMATIPNAMLLCASSPYARRGALWDAFRRYWGKDGTPLVWKAATRDMNPTVRQSIIDTAMERDQASASAEYMAEFRSDIEGYIAREVVEACVTPGVHERPAMAGTSYFAFVDPSGGSADSMTMAVAHKEQKRVVVDTVRERKPPFSPEDVVRDFAEVLKSYRISKVQGDKYAGEWPREQFRKHGIAYDPSAAPKSDQYRDMLPRLNSGDVDLLDMERLLTQIIGLERRTSRSGRDSIDHAPGAHDDVANAVAGVISMAKVVGYNIEALG